MEKTEQAGIIPDRRNLHYKDIVGECEISRGGVADRFGQSGNVRESANIEYTKSGFPTAFTITFKKLYERYEFNMENRNMGGHWAGLFIKTQDGTQIEFTEEVMVKNPIMNLFTGIYLKKQQAIYPADLKKALGETEEI